MAVFGWVWLCALALPSWEVLESKLPSTQQGPPIFEESLPDKSVAKLKPVLYRDKDAVCPYSQQVWLALEAKNIDYATVLVPMCQESPLKMTWPDGTEQTDSLEIIERIQKEFPEKEPNLYPKGISECLDAVRCNIVRFKGVFPRRTAPNLFAPYLFLEKGGLVSNSNHMVTLEETDEVLEEYYQGPFLCGKQFTAADVVWGPWLERYAIQLPTLLPGLSELNPRGGGEYPTLQEWYEAMEEQVPCYSCRVQGDVIQWKRALAIGVEQYNQENDEPVELSSQDESTPIFVTRDIDGEALWKKYAENRLWLAETPQEECVAFLVRNRETIIEEGARALSLEQDDVDSALREVIATLLDKDNDGDRLSGNARDVAAFARQQIAIPRDMGIVPARTLQRIVELAPAPRIA